MLSRLVITFLPRSKCHLISWLQSQSAVILEPPKIKSTTVSTVASKFGKLSSGYRTGKGQFSYQSLRKVIPKNAQTTAQLHSSHTLVK